MRCYLLVLAVVAFFGMLVTSDSPSKTVVHVEVYYESLCGDSIMWIKHELVPMYEEFKDHLNITFVPYGKATHHRDGETKKWTFSCQHGEAECQGNKAQACAIHHIKQSEQLENQQKLTVDFVGCAMTSRYPPIVVSECPQIVGLNSDTQNGITNCLQGSEADELLAANGDKTWALQPQISFVPTVIINGKYSQADQWAALSNFREFTCGLLREDEKPESCTQG